MRLGASIGHGAGDPSDLAQRARDLEHAGVDILWTAELYGFDGVSLMGFLACATDRVQIGSSILPFYSRTPTLMAMTAAGIDSLSGGRCILGIGASGPQVIEGFHGVPYDAPVGRTREIIDICRKTWAREEPVTYDGRYYQLPLPPERGTGLGKPLKLVNHPVRSAVPIYVAALGPRNVEVTAELADGWIPIFFWPEKVTETWNVSLATGTAKRSDALGPLEIVAGGGVVIGDGVEHLRDRARPNLAFYIGGMGAKDRNFYNDLLIRYGYEREAKEIQELFLSGKRDEAARAVPKELVDGTSLIGPAGWVRDRIAAYKEAGVTVLNVNVSGPDATKTIDQLRTWADE
jgi:F420-dependent oxidoreductase-like protein